jgi:transglutaminase-like putative cysteine protease
VATGLSVWMLSLGCSAFVLCLAQAVTDPARVPWLFTLRLSSVTWNILLIIAFVGFWIDLFWISQELLPAGIHFLITLIINKLANLHQRRDVLHLYAVSFMAILASAAMTLQVWYAVLLLLYLFAGVWTLLLYHLTKEYEAARVYQSIGTPFSAHGQVMDRITARFFWSTNGLAALVLCLTVSIFFLLPRVGIGFLQKGRGDSLRTSGFSERVDLGVMGPVKQDPSVVMRVQLPDGKPAGVEPLYLRGMAYDRYNGRAWANTLVNRRSLTERPQGVFTIRTNAASSVRQASFGFKQEILLEALDTSVLFGAPQPISLTGDFVTVQSDSMGVFYLPDASSGRVQYGVRSQSAHIQATDASATALIYPEFIRRQYLQLPALVPEITELSRAVTQGRIPYEAVLLIKRHLLENYRYSLEIETGRSTRPLEDFLFTRKTGYCEHYATAMVVMLRSIGIPARLVTGFLATEWNGFGQYYTVRQRDAHAWVEVYFPKSGWITFDPTPPEPAGAAATWWRSFDGAMDSLRLRWDRLIVQYGADDQLSMIQGVRDGGDALWNKTADTMAVWLNPVAKLAEAVMKEWRGTETDWKQIVLAILVIGSCLFLVFLLVRRLSTRGSVPPRRLGGDVTAAQWYDDLLRLTSAHGFQKPAGHTPLEFARHVEQHWLEASPHVSRLTQLYCRVRFGQGSVSQEDARAAEGLLRALSILKKSHRRFETVSLRDAPSEPGN